MGAGILPVCVNKGGLLFLFGKERYNNQWSDFGGSSELDETIEMTAIREGGEETNGFFGIDLELKENVNKHLIKQIYYESYTTFIFKVPYNKALPYYYNNNNKFVEKYFRKSINTKHNGLYEKDQIKWYSVYDLKKYKNEFRPFYKTFIDVIINNYDDILDDAKKINILTNYNNYDYLTNTNNYD